MEKAKQALLNRRFQFREQRTYVDCIDRDVMNKAAEQQYPVPLRIIHRADEDSCTKLAKGFQEYADKQNLNVRIYSSYNADAHASACVIYVEK